MGEKFLRSAGVCFLLVVPFLGLVGCDSEQPSVEKENKDTGQTNGALLPAAVVPGGTANTDVDTWLADRYGPESGIVEYDVTSGGQATAQTWYFAEHGLREARYWQLDAGADPPVHITIVDSGSVAVRGPGDAVPMRSTWRPDPNTAMPNFRHLTPEMHRLYGVKELPQKTILGKVCSGYRLKIGATTSDVWVWEGLMLYGELQGAAEKNIAPVVLRAVSLQTNVAVPEEKFHIPQK